MTAERTLEPDELRSSRPRAQPGAARVASVTVTRSRQGDDRIVVKSATGAQRVALRREGELLDRLGNAGLVELVEIVELEDGGPDDAGIGGTTRLVTIDAGVGTLADATVSAGDTALTALRRTVASVTRLHERGWLHGSLRPEHVIVGPRGRVRLCSLGAALPIDPADPTAVAADAEGLLQLAEHVGCSHRDQHGLTAPRRVRRRGAELRRLVRELHREGASPAVTIERLAVGLQQIDSTSRRGGWAPRRRPVGSRVLIVASVISVVAVGLVLVAAAARGRASTPGDAGSADTTGAAARSTGATVACAPLGRAPDLDGDGCADAVTVTGHVVQVGTRDYRLGEPGDLAAVGDWNCDGSATARLVRPSTGEVFEFPVWATSGAPSVAQLIGVDPLAQQAVAAQVRSAPGTRGSCDRLMVALPNGEEHELPLEDEESTP